MVNTLKSNTTEFFLLFLIFLTGISLNSLKAQDVYGTTNGIIEISGVWNGENLVATSRELQVTLNYETAEFQIKLDQSSLSTGIDSLDRILRSQRRDLLTYEGSLGVDYIMTKKHPTQKFDIEGILSCAHTDNNFPGTGILEHIEAELYSCVLTMSFDIDLRDTNLEIDLPGLEDYVRVSIMQIVLKRDND